MVSGAMEGFSRASKRWSEEIPALGARLFYMTTKSHSIHTSLAWGEPWSLPGKIEVEDLKSDSA